MRALIITALMVIIPVSFALCQIDTLMLVEINNIEIADDIIELYVEDLDGDEIKDIILCTQYYIYIFDSQTNEPIWTSPLLTNPDDLLFEDINHDGLLDISVHDSLNIYLFDPHNYSTIWVSPTLDSTYKCYTIGDRNDNGWTDVAVVSKEPFTRPGDENNLDTVWINLFDGPDFQQVNGFFILMPNYVWNYGGMDMGYFFEIPALISINILSGIGGISPMIILLSNTSSESNMHGGYSSGSSSGNVYIFGGSSYELRQGTGSGSVFYHDFFDINELIYLYTIGYSSSYHYWPDGGSSNYNRFIKSYSADSLNFSLLLWTTGNGNYSVWRGFLVGNINNISEGDELCVAAQDSLYLYNIRTINQLWITPGISGLGSILSSYNSLNFFNNPTVICEISYPSNHYVFFSGGDGSIMAVLTDNTGSNITQISDLNNDNNDEILSIQGNSLHIYNLDYYVNIDNPNILPHLTYLQPNYPNPFNASTIIEYGLSQPEHVTLEIFDILGRKVSTLADGYQPAGQYRTIWNADNVSSGVYFYKLKAGDYIKTKKMLLLK